jgi:signal peptidase II
MMHYIGYLFIILLGVSADFASKYWVVHTLFSPADYLDPLPILSIVRTHNYGVSFGLLGSLMLSPWFYAGVVAFAISLLGKMAYQVSFTPLRYAVAMIISGAIGNQIDRFLYGYVVDFIDVHWFGKIHFYVFNIADILVTIGAILLALILFFKKDIKI